MSGRAQRIEDLGKSIPGPNSHWILLQSTLVCLKVGPSYSTRMIV